MQHFLISLSLGQFVFGLCARDHRLICSEESFGLCSGMNLFAVTSIVYLWNFSELEIWRFGFSFPEVLSYYLAFTKLPNCAYHLRTESIIIWSITGVWLSLWQRRYQALPGCRTERVWCVSRYRVLPLLSSPLLLNLTSKSSDQKAVNQAKCPWEFCSSKNSRIKHLKRCRPTLPVIQNYVQL